MGIIFLDIDGVLNSQKYLISNHDKVALFYHKYGKEISDELFLIRKMYDIDFSKVNILKEIIDITDAKVVIISSWKKLKIYPYIRDKLIEIGIPIIGETIDDGSDRGSGIKRYILENNIDNYVIIDDSKFDDYDNELIKRLIMTSFYDEGLKEDQKDKVVKILRK